MLSACIRRGGRFSRPPSPPAPERFSQYRPPPSQPAKLPDGPDQARAPRGHRRIPPAEWHPPFPLVQALGLALAWVQPLVPGLAPAWGQTPVPESAPAWGRAPAPESAPGSASAWERVPALGQGPAWGGSPKAPGGTRPLGASAWREFPCAIAECPPPAQEFPGKHPLPGFAAPTLKFCRLPARFFLTSIIVRYSIFSRLFIATER